jgi:hypothetical protein
MWVWRGGECVSETLKVATTGLKGRLHDQPELVRF